MWAVRVRRFDESLIIEVELVPEPGKKRSG
jgi:hypothetical protein